MKNLDLIIHSVNHLYLIIDKVDGYIEEKNVDNKNKKILTKYTELWDERKN